MPTKLSFYAGGCIQQNPESMHNFGVLDPFCGQGSVLAVANQMGFDALGVERAVKRSKKAAQEKGALIVARKSSGKRWYKRWAALQTT